MGESMPSIVKPFSFVLVICVLFSCSSSVMPPDLEILFSERGVDGTILISNLDGSQVYQAFPKRAKKALLPASTFKIPNSLIALKEAAVSSPEEIIKWDGEVRFVDAWNQDHSMRTAFPASCVWFYQELARRIGNEKYLYYLNELDYGNMKTGPDLPRFWLDGDLQITAEEQIIFLKKLYKNDLPFKAETIQIVKDLMLIEQTETYTIRAKTGWAVRSDGEHTWWVGYVEKADQVWVFATNIELTSNDQSQYSKEITREALVLTGVLPQSQKELN
jgi:beta-lactamase class D